MKQNFSDIKKINEKDNYKLESIESNHFGKLFSFDEPYNKDTVEYLEYLYENNSDDLIKLQYYLPNELFEIIHVVTSHYDIHEYKDYSFGSRRFGTDKIYKGETKIEYESVNHDNFKYFMEINKQILQNKDIISKTYEKYIDKHFDRLYTYKQEKDDCYDEIKFKTIYYYKLIKK